MPGKGINYRVAYVGLAEGYDIERTADQVDGFEVFRTFSEAKRAACQKAMDDVRLVLDALRRVQGMKKADVG